MTVDEKLCPKCRGKKPVSDFYKSRNQSGGFGVYCKQCSHARTVAWRNRSPARMEKHRKDNAKRLKERRLSEPEMMRGGDRRRGMKYAYGITPEQFATMLLAQGGGCAICGSKNPKGIPGYRFAIDHCHKTGKMRAILCHPCNKGLGHFYDDADVMGKTAAYLRHWGAFVQSGINQSLNIADGSA